MVQVLCHHGGAGDFQTMYWISRSLAFRLSGGLGYTTVVAANEFVSGSCVDKLNPPPAEKKLTVQ